MEYVNVKDLTLKHSIFTWNIIDFFQHVNRQNFTSSVFSFMNHFWYFRLLVEYSEHECCIQVYLCRGDSGIEDSEVRMRFAVILKSPTGSVFSKRGREYSFETGSAADICFKIYKEKITELKNALYENSLVVICDMIAVGDEITYQLSMDKRLFNEDIMQLSQYRNCPVDERKSWLYGDASLLTEEGTTMRVHKEILSARSPVFRELFLETPNEPLTVPFNQNTVESMLKFLYFANVKEIIDDDGVPHPDLYQCAMVYQVDDLVKLLEPKMMHASTIPSYKKEYLKIQIPDFTKACNPSIVFKSKFRTTERKRNYAEVSIQFDTRKYSFKIVLEKTHPEQSEASVNGCFKFLNENQDEVFSEQCTSSVKENIEFDFDVKIEKLFAKDYMVLPNNVLTIKCQFVTRLHREYSISSPEFHFIQELTSYNGMKYLLENELFADLPVRSANSERNVNKLIMAARSRQLMVELFRNEARNIRFETSQEIFDELLFYMYTGELRDTGRNIDLFHEVMMTFDLHTVTGLRNKCFKEIYKLPLNCRNVLKKYSFADFQRDMLYKQICKEFILANRGIILGNFKWQEFKREYPVLANEIVDFINQNFTKENKFV